MKRRLKFPGSRFLRAASLGLVMLSLGAGSFTPARIVSNPRPPAATRGLDDTGTAIYQLPPGVQPVNRVTRSFIRGARPSYAWRRHGNVRELVSFPSYIQHIVVVDMENRTPDDLFGGYYSTGFSTGGTFGSVLNLTNPAGPTPVLTSNSLGAYFDPDHSHWTAFQLDMNGYWAGPNGPPLYCPGGTNICAATATQYSFVPAPEASPYANLVQQFGYNTQTLQSNEGPSFVSHQFLIAGQSGGLPGSKRQDDETPLAPYALFENPSPPNSHPNTLDQQIGGGSCADETRQVEIASMATPYPGENGPGFDPIDLPCNEYTTLLDKLANGLRPPIAD